MRKSFLLLIMIANLGCSKSNNDDNNNTAIEGYALLNELTGHWVGTNETPFGNFDWFAFDFRPISASHLHSIYEGATNQNIINSVFVADFEGKKQIMARNGGWLGNQYRATYFVLDIVTEDANSKYYRLVDAVGKEKRAYMEFRFENDTLYFDAYKDDSGRLDDPIHHMGFKGVNRNPSFAQPAIQHFNFPQEVAEVNFGDSFENTSDSDSALFLEEANDPFPKSQHGYISDLKVNFEKAESIAEEKLLLYISKEPIVNQSGSIDFDVLNTKVVRTIDVYFNELFYTATYLHPDTYYVTAFTNGDDDFYPSSGDISSISTAIEVNPDSTLEMNLIVNLPIE